MDILKADDRGTTNFGWLDSKHSFAFGHGVPTGPHAMGYRSLRVLNDDRVAPGGGFAEHGHDNMEIVSIVLEGGLAHKDSTGASSTITPGMVQRMTAGSGVRHSEYNASETEPVHFLQIWLHPDREDLDPSYDEKAFDFQPGKLTTVAAPGGDDGALTIHQDARLFMGVFANGQADAVDIDTGRGAWVHVAEGEAIVNGEPLTEGDGVALDDPGRVEIEGRASSSRVLVFDLA